MNKTLFLSFFFFLGLTTYAQSERAPRYIKASDYSNQKDSLIAEYGQNKTLFPDYELQTLIALKFYPELKDVKIEFVYKKLSSTMAARPRILSTFRRKGKRSYKIFLNNVNPEVPLDSASFNAQIGVIGHELGHIADYESKSTIRLITNGFGYMSKKFRRRFERATDQRTMDHGLFWQTYDFSSFIFHYKHASNEYKDYKRKVYLTPEEIEEQK